MFSRLGVPQFGIAGPLQRRPTSNDPRTPGGAAPLAALAPVLGLPRKCREAEAKSNEPAEVQFLEPPSSNKTYHRGRDLWGLGYLGHFA